MAYALVSDHERRKLDSKTQCLTFVGYGSSFGIKGYRLFDERRRKLIIRRDVTFDEANVGQKKETVVINELEDIGTVVEPVGEEDVEKSSVSATDSESEDDTTQKEEKPLRRTRITAGVPPKRFADEFVYHVGEMDEPTTMQEALQSDRQQEWIQAADAEYNSLMKNKTWELVKFPKGRKAVSCKWVFHVKYDKHGKIDRYKARLVAKGYSQDKPCVLAVYVDDIIIITELDEEMNAIKQQLCEGFKMKDMGKLHYLLGISVQMQDGKVMLDQKQYLINILRKFGLEDAKTVSTPSDPNVKLEKEDGYSNPVDATYYQSLVGSLLYAAMATRSNIAHAAGMLGRYNSAPNEAHMTAAKRVCRYLKGTIDIKLVYTETVCEAVGYSDADWASSVDDRHSTSGNVMLIAGGAVSWLSKRQATVALSTAEAEYVSLTTMIQEAIWIRRLLQCIGEKDNTVTVFEDNQGAIKMAQNPVMHSRTKHIDIRYHFIRETIVDGTVTLRYCPTKDMRADCLTKSLSKGRFEMLRKNLGLSLD